MADESTEAAGGTEVPLTDLLEQTISVALKRMAGPVVGKVDTYDPATGRCSVKPLVPLLVNGELLEAPKLPSVPVMWPETGSHSIKLPLPKDSLVTLAPLGHDHSEWMTSGSPDLAPPSERRFSLADLVASPLVPSPLATPPDPLSYHATKAVLFGEHLVGGSDATKATALHLDAVNKDAGIPAADFASWMTSVEAIAQAGGGVVSPLAATITKIGAVQATATKLKAK